MELAVLSFIAGVLTAAAPCILPLLPIVIGGTATIENGAAKSQAWFRPLVIVGSLAASVVFFTLLLKATTVLLGVPQILWATIAGGIVLLFGCNLLFPAAWERLMIITGFHVVSNKWLGVSYAQKGIRRDILLGVALGPVFNSCSPTYALIIAAVLPVSLAKGILYLVFYAFGLAAILLVIAATGQSIVKKLGWLSNPSGWFRRMIGAFFIVVGIAVIFGLDRSFQAFVLEQGWYNPIMRLEQQLGIE